MISQPNPPSNESSGASSDANEKSVRTSTGQSRRLRWIVVGLVLAAVLIGSREINKLRLANMDVDQAIAALESGNARGGRDGVWGFVDEALSHYDYSNAHAILRREAANDDARAAYYFGLMKEEGLGGHRNMAAAFQSYLKAAQLDYEPAYLAVGSLYRQGLGTPKNHAESTRWYLKAAQAGNTQSYGRLAYLYLLSDQLEPNLVEGEIWLERAIATGSAYALRVKANAHLDGLYGSVDTDLVLDLLQQAALKGDTYAMDSLFSLLANQGLTASAHPEVARQTENLEEAYKWALIAASHWSEPVGPAWSDLLWTADFATLIPTALLEGYSDTRGRTYAEFAQIQIDEPYPPRPPVDEVAVRAQYQEINAITAQMVGRAMETLRNPSKPQALPQIPGMPYRLGRDSILRAEREAAAFLATKPFEDNR